MTTKNRSAKTSTAAIVTRAVAQPMDISIPQPKIDLDLRVTTQDLVDIKISEASEQLALERETAERTLNKRLAEHTKLQDMLKKQAAALIDAQGIGEDVSELARRLDSFSGEKHAITLVAVDTPTYHYGEKKDNAPQIDIEKLAIVGEIRIAKGDRNNSSIIATRKVTIMFTDAMKLTVTEIEAATIKVRAATDALTETKKRIADLPRLGQRAKAELTKAYLRGQLTNTQKMLDTVLGTNVKALPMLTGGGVDVTEDAA